MVEWKYTSAVCASAVINVEFIQWVLYRIFRVLTVSCTGQSAETAGGLAVIREIYIYVLNDIPFHIPICYTRKQATID